MYVKKVGGSASLGSGDGITFAYSLFTQDYNRYFRGDTRSTNLNAYITSDAALAETELVFMLQCWRANTVFNNFKFQIEIVPGTAAPTTYAPYIGQTATLTLPRTIYGGTVDAVTGEGKEMYALITLDGSEGWYTLTDYVNTFFWGGFPVWGSNRQPEKAYCPIATYNTHRRVDADGEFAIAGFETDPGWIGFKFTAYTLETWKAYLAAQYAAGTPVQVCYKLATTTPFTATGAQPISALSGVNTVLTDADSATVTGRADPIKRITDLEDAVASMT